MELIDLKANSVLKIKFHLLSSLSNVSGMINFWRSSPCENFPELKKIVQTYACRFGVAGRCEQAFSSMHSINNKLKSQLFNLNAKNALLLSVTNLTPNTIC